MGMWYKRTEAQKRFSFFFSSTTLAGAFGGLLAYGLGQMEGVRGYRGWRWVFIIEGLITCVVAIVWFFVLPDFPEEVKWLTEEEREFVRVKLAKDVGRSAHHIQMGWREVWGVLKDCMLILSQVAWCEILTVAIQTRSLLEASCTLVSSSPHTVGGPSRNFDDSIVV